MLGRFSGFGERGSLRADGRLEKRGRQRREGSLFCWMAFTSERERLACIILDAFSRVRTRLPVGQPDRGGVGDSHVDLCRRLGRWVRTDTVHVASKFSIEGLVRLLVGRQFGSLDQGDMSKVPDALEPFFPRFPCVHHKIDALLYALEVCVLRGL